MSVAPTLENYFKLFLQGLGMPVTQDNLDALYGVARLEGWNDRYNPLNVVQPEPGSTDYNSVGVQTFADFDSGVRAAVTLFSNDHWTGVRDALAKGNDAQGVLSAFKQAYTWDPNVQFSLGSPSDGTRMVGANGGSGQVPSTTDLSAPSDSPTTTSNGKLTEQRYQDALGVVQELINQVPELSNLIKEAQAQNKPIEWFVDQVHQTHWWHDHGDGARKLIGLQLSDPASYVTEMRNTYDLVSEVAQKMGVHLTWPQLKSLAVQYQVYGWTGTQLQDKVGGAFKPGGAFEGDAAGYAQQLRSMYDDYGVPYTENDINSAVQSLLTGSTTIDTFKEHIINSAKSMYPSLSSQIAGGMTTKQIASPYVNTMSNLLEIAPDTISLQDPTIKKALQGSVIDQGQGKATVSTTPIWQFENQLREDPRWSQTQNAHDTINSALATIGRDWGFLG